jgi:hypothetical protein
LVHVTLEAEKSQNLQLETWRPRRGNGVSSSLEAGEGQCPSPCSQVREVSFYLVFFCFIQALNCLERATHIREVKLCYSPLTQMLISLTLLE